MSCSSSARHTSGCPSRSGAVWAITRFFQKLAANDRFAQQGKILRRNRHRSDVIIGPGSLVQHVVAVNKNVLWRDLHAAMLRIGRTGFGEEADKFSIRCDLDGAYLRQHHIKTLHSQLVHADLRHVDMKTSSRSRQDFRLNDGLKGRLAWKRIGKAKNSTPGHFLLPASKSCRFSAGLIRANFGRFPRTNVRKARMISPASNPVQMSQGPIAGVNRV